MCLAGAFLLVERQNVVPKIDEITYARKGLDVRVIGKLPRENEYGGVFSESA